MVNLGMIGVGSLRETGYLEALRTLDTRLQVRAVYDPVFARAQQVATELGAVAAGGLLALARRCDIRALLVLDGSWILPGALSLLASTGKPLLVAGNPAENAEPLCQLRQLAGDRGQTVVPELDLRYSPATFRLQELMATRLGRPSQIVVDVYSREFRPESDGAGLSGQRDPLHRQGSSAVLRSGLVVSLVDWCRHLCGSPPVSVETRCPGAGQQTAGDVEQAAAGKSAVCEVHASFAGRGGSDQPRRISLRIFETNGGGGAAAVGEGEAACAGPGDEAGQGASWTAQVVCENGTAEIVGSHLIHWRCSGQEDAVVSEELSDDRPGRVVMLDHFCRRVVGGLIPVADIQDVCRSIRFVDAACASLHSGQPVALNSDLPQS